LSKENKTIVKTNEKLPFRLLVAAGVLAGRGSFASRGRKARSYKIFEPLLGPGIINQIRKRHLPSQ